LPCSLSIDGEWTGNGRANRADGGKRNIDTAWTEQNPDILRAVVSFSLEERPLNSPQERCLAECNVSAKMRLKKLGLPIT